MTIKRTPEEWCRICDVTVLDPDGWDRQNYYEDWRKPLTFEEFSEKLFISTILPGPTFDLYLKVRGMEK